MASILLIRRGLRHWDAPRTLISSPSTDTSIRDCLCLTLGLSGHSLLGVSALHYSTGSTEGSEDSGIGFSSCTAPNYYYHMPEYFV